MKTIEVSIKDFFIVVSRQWLMILLSGILLASAWVVSTKLLPSNVESSENTQQETVLLKSIESIEARLSELLVELEQTNNDLANHRDNFSQTAFISFSVFIENTEMTVLEKYETADRIINQYLVLANHASLREIFKDKNYLTRSEKELQQRVKVYKESNSIITIEAARINVDEGLKIAEKILDYLRMNQQNVAASTVDHAIIVISSSVKDVFISWAVDREAAYLKRADNYNTSITDLKSQLETENKKLGEIAEKNKPDLSGQQDETQASSFILNTLIFFLVGVFLAAFAVIFSYVIKLDLLLPDQIRRLFGVRFLGGVQRKQSVFSSGFGIRLSGKLLKTNEAEAIELIMANIGEAKGTCRKILVTGTLDESIIADFTKKIKAKYENDEITFVHGGDVNSSAATVRKLAEADCVVLIERLNRSKLRNVNILIERIESSGKTVLGYVMF